MKLNNFLKKNYNFRGKNILITGALGSIGLKLVKFFYYSDTNLILTDKTNEKRKINNLLKIFKKKIVYIPCDLSSSDDKKKLIKLINKKYKKIDIIINNAALTGDQLNKKPKKYLNENSKHYLKELEVNLVSSIEIIKGTQKLLANSKGASIVNISSIYGFMAPKFEIYKNTNLTNHVGYSISKGGLIQLTKWLASYLAPNVRVNCVSPGGVKRKQASIFVNSYIKHTLLKKMATDDDVVNGVIFLSSDAARYITAHNLIIDGGWSS